MKRGGREGGKEFWEEKTEREGKERMEGGKGW
jgi:hypothetical protein